MTRFQTVTALATATLALAACDATPTVDYRAAALDRGNAAVAECAATQCTRLDLDSASLADYSVLSGMTHVKALMVSYTDFDDLADIAGMTQLEELHIGDTEVTDLSGLAAFPNLKLLHAQGLYRVTDYSPVTRLRGVTDLAIGDYDFDPSSIVAAMPQLRSVALFLGGEVDLSPLRAHPGLQVVDLGSSWVDDLSVLATLPRLRTVSLPEVFEEDPSYGVLQTLRARGVEVLEEPAIIVC